MSEDGSTTTATETMHSSTSTMSPDAFDIDELLLQAKNNLTNDGEKKPMHENNDSHLSKLQAGLKSLPKVSDSLGQTSLKPLPSKGAVKLLNDDSINRSEEKGTNQFRKVVDPIKVKQQEKLERESNAGNKWFNMPKTEMTPEIKRDLQLLKMRNVLDRKRHYKKDNSKFPTYFQTGTIIEGNTEYYSARLTNKERKKTLAEEVLADSESRKYFKRKYGEIQNSKLSGRKAHHKKIKEMRKKK